MSYGDNGLSPSDVALLSNRNGSNGCGDNGSWWIILFLIFAFAGFGRGFGGNNGGSGIPFIPYNVGGFGSGNDLNTIQRQLDLGFSTLNSDINQVNNNVTNGFYNMNTSLLNGFGTINTNIANGFATSNLATANGFATTQRQICESTDSINANINNNGYETRLLGVNMNSQLQQCCCDLRANVADLKYTIAQENCLDRQTINEGIRNVITSNTANTQAILDKLCQQEIDAKNETIANLRTQVNMQNLAASQANQTNDIINAVRPCPIPSYLTCSPYQSIPVQYVAANGCGCNNGCGGNSNLF